MLGCPVIDQYWAVHSKLAIVSCEILGSALSSNVIVTSIHAFFDASIGLAPTIDKDIPIDGVCHNLHIQHNPSDAETLLLPTVIKTRANHIELTLDDFRINRT